MKERGARGTHPEAGKRVQPCLSCVSTTCPSGSTLQLVIFRIFTFTSFTLLTIHHHPRSISFFFFFTPTGCLRQRRKHSKNNVNKRTTHFEPIITDPAVFRQYPRSFGLVVYTRLLYKVLVRSIISRERVKGARVVKIYASVRT